MPRHQTCVMVKTCVITSDACHSERRSVIYDCLVLFCYAAARYMSLILLPYMCVTFDIRNNEIRKAATVQPITTHLMQNRLPWYGHVRRGADNHVIRSVLDMEVEDVRSRGRPKLRYMNTIRRDIKKNGPTNVNILDRNDWRMALSRATH